MCELSRVGELGRRAFCGGGVDDIARGLLYADVAGEDATGEVGSMVCRGGGSPNRLRIFSSSDGALISTSFSSVDKKDGGSPVANGERALCAGDAEWLVLATAAPVPRAEGCGEDADADADATVPFAARSAGSATDAGGFDAGPASLGAPMRRVRGRFSLRSGSCDGSMGDPVAERDFRFRVLTTGVAVARSKSRARSKSPHACRSSWLCWTAAIKGRLLAAAVDCAALLLPWRVAWCRMAVGMLRSNTSWAPSRRAISSRSCQRSNSRRSLSRSRSTRRNSSRASSSSWSTSMFRASQMRPVIWPQAPCHSSDLARRLARRMVCRVRGKKSLRAPRLAPDLRPDERARLALGGRRCGAATEPPKRSTHSMQNQAPSGTLSRPMQCVW